MERNEFITKYDKAYFEMRDAAIEKIKNYGKTFDVYAKLRQMLMKEKGYKDESEIYEDEWDNYKWENVYSCVFKDRHETLCEGNITMVRYNSERQGVDILFEEFEGYFHEWIPQYYVEWGVEYVWRTILDFID